MRVIRTGGVGCANDSSCACMPSTGMANGFNTASVLPGMPQDKPFGAFDASMGTITFPVAPLSGSSLTAVAQPDGTVTVVSGTQTLASGLTPSQASDFITQNAPNGAATTGLPLNDAVAANILSGNPLQPSIVGMDDGSGQLYPPPSFLCQMTDDINNNPWWVLAGVGVLAYLLTKRGK